MRVGIFAKTFADAGLDAALDAVVANRVAAIQFNLALAGGETLPGEIPGELATAVRESVERRALDMVAVSGTYNMAHPDESVRRAGRLRLRRLIAAAPALGTSIVTICTGTRDPHDMWRRHPGNDTPEAWSDMLDGVRDAVDAAQWHGVVVAFEPEPGNVVDGPVAGRRLLEAIDSPHLGVVFDAANLIRPEDLERQAAVLERSIELLGGDVVLAHAKDVRRDGAIVPAGRGHVDYRRYVELLRDTGYDGALVLHGLTPEDVDASVAFLERHLEQLAEVS